MQIQKEEKKHIQKLERLTEKNRQLLEDAIPESTKRAYRSDWNKFTTWCTENGFEKFPSTPEIIALYLTDISDQYKPSTLERRLASISKVHQYAGYESPTQNDKVRNTLNAIKRKHGTKQDRKKPLMTKHIRKICDGLSDSLKDIRDRALFLVGYAGALRRSELVSLKCEDIKFIEEGLEVHIRRSKTDQQGEGRLVGISYGSHLNTCPVRSMKRWLDESEIEKGYIFRRLDKGERIYEDAISTQAVALVIKKRVEDIGLNPDHYSGHSLRSGFVTQGCQNEIPTHKIRETTGHSDDRSLQPYIRPVSIWKNNASARIGL